MKKSKGFLFLMMLAGFFLVNCLNPNTEIWLEEPVSEGGYNPVHEESEESEEHEVLYEKDGYTGNRSITDPELNRRVEIIVVKLD